MGYEENKDELINEKGRQLIDLFRENYEMDKEEIHKEFGEHLIKIHRTNYGHYNPERSKREDALTSEVCNPNLAAIMKPLKEKYDNTEKAMRCSEHYGNIVRDK